MSSFDRLPDEYRLLYSGHLSSNSLYPLGSVHRPSLLNVQATTEQGLQHLQFFFMELHIRRHDTQHFFIVIPSFIHSYIKSLPILKTYKIIMVLFINLIIKSFSHLKTYKLINKKKEDK